MSDYLKRNPHCEISAPMALLAVPGWIEFLSAWEGHQDAKKLDPHHIYGRQFGDAEWNLIAAWRPAHEFVQSTRIGRLVCLLIKDAKGELEREAVRLRTGRDPLGLIANDLENGIFQGRLEKAARRLCERYGV